MSGWSADDVDLPSGMSELSNALRSATSPPEADVSLFQIAGPSRPRSTSPSPESHPSGDHGVPSAHTLTLERLLGVPRPRTQSPPTTDRQATTTTSTPSSSRDAARMRAQRSQLGMSWPNDAIDARRRGRDRPESDDFPWRNAVETARRAGYTVNERIRREREREQAGDAEGGTPAAEDTDARTSPSTARRQETSATARVIRDLVRQPRSGSTAPIAIPGRSSVISLGPEQVVPTASGFSWASYHAGTGRSMGAARGAASSSAVGGSSDRNIRMATSLLRRRREDEGDTASGDGARRATDAVETTRTLDDNTTSRTRIAYSYDPTDIEPPGGTDDHIWDMLGTLDSSDDEDHDGVGRERWGTYRTGMPIGDLPGPQALLFDYFDVDGWGSPPDGGAALSRGRYNRRRQSMRGRATGASDAEGERDAPFAIDFGTSDARSTRTAVPIDRASSRHLVRRGRATFNDTDSEGEASYPATPLKRRKCDEPQPDSARPSYLALSTLPADTQLPTCFQTPIRSSSVERTSHFVVTVAERRGVARPIVSYQPRARDRANLTREDSDACSLHTSRPIPAGVGVYYFEVEVVGSGDEDYISVGWTRAGVNHRRLVGWNNGSWGWHADDGKIFEGHGEGRDFSKPWGTGDIVGCGIDYTTGRAFFTQNGKLLGHAFSAMPHELYPAVGMRNPHESVAVNFTGPFVYDIDAHVRGVQERIRGALAPAHEAFSDVPKPGSVPRLVGVPSKAGTSDAKSDTAGTPDAAAATAAKDLPTLSEPEALLLMKIKAKVAAVKSEVASAKAAEEAASSSSSGSGALKVPELPDGSALRDAPRRAAAALVLDHLDVAGLAGVRSLMLRDMRARGLLPPDAAAESLPKLDVAESSPKPAVEASPVTKSSYPSAAAAVLAAAAALRSGDVQWSLIRSFGADLGGIENRLHIYAFASAARASAAAAARDNQSMDVDDESDGDESDDTDERVVAAGRELRRRARSERWAAHDVALLDRAARQLVAPDDSLDDARNADADRLDTLLRDAAGVKRHSCLHRAVAQTGLVHDVLRDHGDEVASFMGMGAVL